MWCDVMWHFNLRCCNVFAVLMPCYVVVCRVALLRSSHSLLSSHSYVHDVCVCAWGIACYVYKPVCLWCVVHSMFMVYVYGEWQVCALIFTHSLTHSPTHSLAAPVYEVWQVYTVCCVACVCVCRCVYDVYVYVWCTACAWCNDMFMVCIICTALHCTALHCTVLYASTVCVCVWWVAGDKCLHDEY